MALLFAAQHGDEASVKRLLAAGANVNVGSASRYERAGPRGAQQQYRSRDSPRRGRRRRPVG